jgi:hypothetical protein
VPSKLEQEIEEILERTGGPPPPARFRRPSRIGQTLQGWLDAALTAVSRINPGQLMLASILIMIGSWFVLRRYETAMLVVALIGFALFALAFVLSFIKRRRGAEPSSGSERYWRGQPIDYTDSPSSGLRNPFRNIFGRRR